MVMGYGLIAVPTGVVSAELVKQHPTEVSTQACLDCGQDRLDINAGFCKFCGAKL